MMLAVGGKTEGSGDVSAETKTDTTNVPVTWWPMPNKWYDELIHMFFVKLVIDLTPADANLFGLRSRIVLATSASHTLTPTVS